MQKIRTATLKIWMPLPPWRRPAFGRGGGQKKNLPGGWPITPTTSGRCSRTRSLLCGRLCDRYPDLTDEMYADASLHDAHGRGR